MKKGKGVSSAGESSKQLEEGKEENMQTGTANEPGNKRTPGRPPGPPKSEEEKERRRKEKNEKDRLYRGNHKNEFVRLQKLEEKIKLYFEEEGNAMDFEAFCEEKVKEQGKFCEELGMVSEALWVEQAKHQLAAALATQGRLFSTNKGTQIQLREAAHDKEASTSSWATPPQQGLGPGSKQEVSMYNLVKQYGKLKDAKKRQQEAAAASNDANRKFKEKKKEADNLNKQVNGLEEEFSNLKAELAEKGKISKDGLELQMIDAVTLGWNLMKKLLQSMHAGSEFLHLPLLDTIQLYPSLQNQFNEGLTLIGQGHPIDDKVAIQSNNPPVVVPRSFFLHYNLLENGVEWELNAFAPPGDAVNIAANSPQFQAVNVGANNVEQEDDANDQEDG